MATAADVTLERSPFQGLGFYTEADAKWFFGRLTERRIILAHLRTARLTLLYAESGVGKSSLLRAGVSARLQELASRAEPGRSPRYIPVVFSAWKDDPVQDLIAAVRGLAGDVLAPASEVSGAPDGGGGLAAAITTAASALNATLVIMLDQFEEHFSYRHSDAQPDRLADELARCINAPEVPANFLIAVREDAYGRLGDLFSGRIGNVYDNYLHLEYMSRAAAREAIEGPVALYNAEHDADEAIVIEDELTEAVLDEVRRGNLELGGQRADRDGGGRWSSAVGDEVETPFLQLVMTRMWECERAQNSHVLRLTTLEDELGGAEAIVRNHVSRALAGLDESQLETATDIFRDLVTPSGAKVAHTAADLAKMSGQRTDTVTTILDRLYEERILRAVDPAPGTSQARYEIFHDRLAAPILDWRDRQENARLQKARDEAEAEAEIQRRQARRFRRRARIMLVLAVSLLAVLVGLAIALRYAHNQSATANREKQAALSERSKATAFLLTTRAATQPRPAIALLLYLAAYRAHPQPDAERNVLASLNAVDLSHPLGILHGHTDTVEDVAFDPHSRMLASVSADGTARLWRITGNGALPLGPPLRAHEPLYSVAFSPDGRTLASGSFNDIILWNVAHGTEQQDIRYHADGVAGIAYDPHGDTLAAAGADGTILLLDPATHRRRTLDAGQGGLIRSLAFSPNGRLLAVAGASAVTILNVATGRPVTPALTDPKSTFFSGVAFSPDGRIVAAASGQNGRIALWDTRTHRRLGRDLRSERPVNSVAFIPGSDTLVAAGEGTTVLWNTATHRRIAALSGHVGAIDAVATSPDGRLLASAGADRTILLWRRSVGPSFGAVVLQRPSGFSSVSLSREGQIAAGALDGAVVVSRLDGTHAATLAVPEDASGAVTEVAFDPSRQVVAAAYDDSSIRLWDVGSGQVLARTVVNGGPTYAIAFNRQGTELVSGSASGDVRLWNADDLRPVGATMNGGRGVFAVAFSPDGHEIATGGNDRIIRLWDARTQKPLTPSVIPQDEAVFGLAVSPRGDLLASGNADDAIHIWRRGASDYTETKTLTGHSNFVRSVAWSPNGATLASGSTDTTVRLWDVGDGTQLGAAFNDDTRSVESVAFQPDGRVFASASTDGTVRLWPGIPPPRTPDALRAKVCELLGAGLSRTEWSQYATGVPFQQTCPRSTPG